MRMRLEGGGVSKATVDGDEAFDAIQHHLRTIAQLKEENRMLEVATDV